MITSCQYVPVVCKDHCLEAPYRGTVSTNFVKLWASFVDREAGQLPSTSSHTILTPASASSATVVLLILHPPDRLSSFPLVLPASSGASIIAPIQA